MAKLSSDVFAQWAYGTARYRCGRPDRTAIGRIFRVLAKRDQYVEGQKQRLPWPLRWIWRGPSLQRAEDRCVCSNTVIGERVAQDKGSVRIRRIDFHQEAADSAKSRSISHLLCLWGRFATFLIESEIYAVEQFKQRFRQVGVLLFPLHVYHRPPARIGQAGILPLMG
jgi:hypothetical protein